MNAKKKAALGRGLETLLSNSETNIATKFDIKEEEVVISTIASIKIENIQTNPYQPRNNFEEETLKELALSIKAFGVIQPITVRKLGYNKYQIISGERRYKAAKIVKLEEIPAYIRTANDQLMLEMALVENIQREDLNGIEIAHSYERLIYECKLTQEKLSKRVGKNRTTITNYLRLLKLPAIIQKGLVNNFINVGHARSIINVENPDIQKEIYQIIIEKGLSVRDVEKIVRIVNNGGSLTRPTRKTIEVPVHIEKTLNILSQQLDTKVKININEDGKGNLNIPFSSDNDFKRIIKLLEKK